MSGNNNIVTCVASWMNATVRTCLAKEKALALLEDGDGRRVRALGMSRGADGKARILLGLRYALQSTQQQSTPEHPICTRWQENSRPATNSSSMAEQKMT